VEELPFISTKGRTTSKKPGRAAFLDVTNEVNQLIRSEDSSGSVKNLSAEFEPAEVSSGSCLAFLPALRVAYSSPSSHPLTL